MPTRERRLREAAEANGEPAGDVGESELPDTTLDDLVAEFASEIPAQEAAREPTVRDWIKYQRLYLGKPHAAEKDYPWVQASNVVVPIAGEDVERMRARIMQTIFSVEPLWNVKQRNRKWGLYAQPLQRFLDAIRSDVFDIYAVVDELVLEVLKLGTSALYNDWIDQTTYRYDDDLKATVPAGRVIGPQPRWLPIEDILVPQGYANHQTAPWCAVRSWYSMARLRELEFTKTIENVDKIENAPDSETLLRRERRSGAAGRMTANPTMTTSVGERAINGTFSPWTVFFRRDLDQDGYPEEYVMMLHVGTKTLLRFKPNPYPSAMRPLVVARFIPIEGEFYGIGIPQMVEHQQEEASTIHNERRDAAHLANIIMWISDITSNLTDTIRPAMGKNIKVVGGPDKLKQLRVTDNRQTNIYEENVVVDQAQRRVGTNDLARGNITSPVGRAAATTSMIAAQEGAQLHDMNISAIRRALEEVGIQVCELYQTHGLPEPEDAGSPEAFLDDEEAALVRQLLGTQDNLRGMVKVKLNASTSSINREVEKQNLVQLVGIVTNYITQVTTVGLQISSPMMAPELKVAMVRALKGLDDTVKLLLQAFNRFDLESILSADLVQQLAVASIQTQAMMAGMGDPSAIMGGGGESAGGAAPQLPSPPVSTQQSTGAPGSGPGVTPYEPGPAVQ